MMLTDQESVLLHVRWSTLRALFLAVILVLIPAAAMAQSATTSVQGIDDRLARKSPLGTQVPPDKALPLLRAVAIPEAASEILQRTGTAHNAAKVTQADMVAEGTVTVQSASGPIAFSVTLLQNGEHGSQRILLKQSDGKLWDGKIDHLAPGGAQALEFLETMYRRGLQQLLKSQERDAAVADNGIKGSYRVVTVLEENGQYTRYSLDPATSRMIQFEFIRGQSRDLAGNVNPVVHSYAFADFRASDAVVTPFHSEHAVNGAKQEELQLTKVRYTTAISAPLVPEKH